MAILALIPHVVMRMGEHGIEVVKVYIHFSNKTAKYVIFLYLPKYKRVDVRQRVHVSSLTVHICLSYNPMCTFLCSQV